MDVIEMARRVAALRPEVVVPCPVCAAAPQGRNLDRHLTKHPGAVVGTSWRGTGRLPRRLDVDGDAVRLRTVLVRRRLVPRAVEVGGLTRRRDTSAGNDAVHSSVEVRQGTYLALVSGRRRITVRCTQSTDVRRHWSGLTQERLRRRWDLTLAPGDFVALQHVLASRGLVQPR